jgi:hypothetical protein
MTMWSSPHKRGRRRSLRVKEYKTSTGGNRGGNSGGGVKRVPDQPPGYPSGKCLGAGKEHFCRCGKHGGK